VRWELVPSNPFDGVQGGHQANESRTRFMPRLNEAAARQPGRAAS
jgi:hypothetical protein